MVRTAALHAATTLDSIKRSLVGLRMPGALEVLDATVRRIEQGEIDGIRALDEILTEELTLRENRRVKTALLGGAPDHDQDALRLRLRLPAPARPGTHPGAGRTDFRRPGRGGPPSDPPGTGKSHLAIALAAEAVKAGRSVEFSTLAALIASLAKAERDGTLRERIRHLCRTALLIVDEIGYLPVVPGGGQPVLPTRQRPAHERGAMILASNRSFAEWGEVFGDPVVATALLDRLLHHAVVIQIEGASYRLRQHADLVPEQVRSKALITRPPAPKRRGRPPGKATRDHAVG